MMNYKFYNIQFWLLIRLSVDILEVEVCEKYTIASKNNGILFKLLFNIISFLNSNNFKFALFTRQVRYWSRTMSSVIAINCLSMFSALLSIYSKKDPVILI